MARAKKRKKFFEVEMPLIDKKTQLYAYTPEDLAGRMIKYDLTRLLKGKNLVINLNVKPEGEKITTIPKKLELIQSALKRMVRRGTSYIEDSFSVNCKDAQLRIKPFLVARRRIHRSIKKAIRERTKQELTEYVKDKTTETLFDEIIKNRLQKFLSSKVKKVYPLSACEIRTLEVEKYFEEPETENKQQTE